MRLETAGEITAAIPILFTLLLVFLFLFLFSHASPLSLFYCLRCFLEAL